MAFSNYASSLRGDRGPQDRHVESGVPFFVPQLSKVKTNVTCQVQNQHLLFCFEKTGGAATEAAATNGSYRKQGNQDLYSQENLLKRQRLQDEKSVVAALGRFWDTFPHIRQGHLTLDKRDYVDVFMKFFKALVSPSEFSMAEARKIVERDWKRDMGDTEVMTRAVFFHALFEVADIWTVGIGADIYSSFLNKLYDRVTMKVYDQEKAVWLTVFADIDKIRPFAEPKSDHLPSTMSATAVAVDITNQDPGTRAALPIPSFSSSIVTTLSFSSSLSSSSDAESPSSPFANSKPPLLKKKTMSVPDGLGSPTKAHPISMFSAAEAMGGSLRRLPDLQAVATDAVRMMQQGILNRGAPRSPVAQFVEASSSRSEVTTPSPTIGSTLGDNLTPPQPAQRHRPTAGIFSSPTRATQKSSTGRKDAANAKGVSTTSHRKKDDDLEPAQATAAPSPELPPQHVRLAMPSIYLSPEITPAHGNEKAARRRIRESMKLAQRLRRITF